LILDLKKVEEEIEKTETAIKHKRIQKKELQDNIKNPANPSEKEKEEINEEEDLEPWQEIYAANRRQAAKSHAKGLSFLNPALTETGLGFRGTIFLKTSFRPENSRIIDFDCYILRNSSTIQPAFRQRAHSKAPGRDESLQAATSGVHVTQETIGEEARYYYVEKIRRRFEKMDIGD